MQSVFSNLNLYSRVQKVTTKYSKNSKTQNCEKEGEL